MFSYKWKIKITPSVNISDITKSIGRKMAEGGLNPGHKTKEDLLCCSVCMEKYDDPRALPCLHTFCYKCLIQLSTRETKGMPPEWRLSSYISNAFNIPKQEEVLKCPLCAEEHPIPKEKGIAGFRKDFRIYELIDQEKLQDSDQMQVRVRQEIPEAAPETCSLHANRKLL